MKSMYFLLRELGNLSLDFHDPLLPLLFPRILKRLHDVAHVDALQRGGVDADLEQDLDLSFCWRQRLLRFYYSWWSVCDFSKSDTR